MSPSPSPDTRTFRLGNRIAPPRFLAFLALILIGVPIGVALTGWRMGSMLAFDLAASVFLGSCIPLLSQSADEMRATATRNDANRAGLLLVTSIVMIAVLVSVASELQQSGSPKPLGIACIIATLALAWIFSNTIYALHYAHLFYSADAQCGGDTGGLSYPDTKEPDYWDFVYFSFCLGMTFQTSDVSIETGIFRRVVTAHCLAAFVFNLGVIAFTINVLGGG